jgi:hypothetical protein
MSAIRCAIPVESSPAKSAGECLCAIPAPVTAPMPLRQPTLKVVPLLRPTQPRRFARVPTHAVGVFPEHREYPRASLKLPLRLRAVNDIAEPYPITLVTRDISSSGVFFLCPKSVAVDATIKLEIVLISRPLGLGNVAVHSLAKVRRIEPAAVPGWFGIAASFEDMEFDRDDGAPRPFLG